MPAGDCFRSTTALKSTKHLSMCSSSITVPKYSVSGNPLPICIISGCVPLCQCLWCLCLRGRVSLLQDLAVEVGYPRCAICRLPNRYVNRNAAVMSSLLSGKKYRVADVGLFTAGSWAESLAMEPKWGHPPADRDHMVLHGHILGVDIPTGCTPCGAASLKYHPEGSPPAYCKLEVTDLPALKKILYKEHTGGHRCTTYAGGRHWLDTYQTVRLTRDIDETVSGPAQQYGLDEYIFTLVCSDPHPDLQREFYHRYHHQWPPAHVIKCILQLPMLLVLVGHKPSKNFKREARISWSHCEIKIMQELSESVRQGYIACKYVLKRFLTVHRSQTKAGDGRSRVGSFHIKTVFLHYLEKRPPQMITSSFGLFMDLLNDLDRYLEVGKLPHYFLSECDLLVTVDSEERRIARQAIQAILSDPVTALLTSPTQPHQIYGEVRPDALVNSFQRVVTNPTCQRSWQGLFVLLARVDHCRHKRYLSQQRLDESLNVSGRPEMTVLIDALRQTKYS